MLVWIILAVVVLIAGTGIWVRSGARMPWSPPRRDSGQPKRRSRNRR